jgi:hypothetical protein
VAGKLAIAFTTLLNWLATILAAVSSALESFPSPFESAITKPAFFLASSASAQLAYIMAFLVFGLASKVLSSSNVRKPSLPASPASLNYSSVSL